MRILCIEPITNGPKFILIFLIVIAFMAALVWFCLEMSEEHQLRKCLWKRIVSGVISFVLLVSGILIIFLLPHYIPNKYKYHVEIMDYDEAEEQLKNFNVTETHGNLAILEDK